MPTFHYAKLGEVAPRPGIQDLGHQVQALLFDGQGVIQYVRLHGAPLSNRPPRITNSHSALAVTDGVRGTDAECGSTSGLVPRVGYQRNLCMMCRPTSRCWGCLNASGTVPMIVKPSDSHSRMAGALVSTTALNCIAK